MISTKSLLSIITIVILSQKVICSDVSTLKIKAYDYTKCTFNTELPGSLHAQEKQLEPISLNGSSSPIPLVTPGDELMKYSRHMYIGYGLLIGGQLLSIVGLTADLNNANTSLSSVGLVGLIVSVAGIVFMLESHSHIGKAGRLLNQQATSSSQRVKVISGSDGIGLALSLSQ